MSQVENLHHIVFRTLRSEKVIPEEKKRVLLAYIYNVSVEMHVEVLRINCYLNHVHLFVNLPPDLSVSAYVRKVKGTSSHVFQNHVDFPDFKGWAKRYGSFSKSKEDRNKIISYIRNQEEHHRYKSFREELEDLFGKDFFDDQYNREDWFDEPVAL